MNLLPSAASLRRRLFVYLGGGLLLLWLLAAIGSAAAALHEINEAADSQMAQLARTLLQVAPHAVEAHRIDTIEQLLPQAHGAAEDNNHGFAVWDAAGRLLLADGHGRDIPLSDTAGFHNNRNWWQGGAWRYLYLHDADSGHTVAVSQRLKERLAILTNALWAQLGSLLLSLPLLLGLIAYGIRRGLQPLDALAADLRQRQADSLQPVDANVPAEVAPLVSALNGLLQRLADTLARERRFTADAAHELRSPLAALKVQTEVWALSTDPAEQQHHVRQVQAGIARAQRLTEQLLVLARLDPLEQVPDAVAIDWPALAVTVLQELNVQAREKHIRLQLVQAAAAGAILPVCGNRLLLELMLRNLLDNAIRYGPEHSRVTLILAADHIAVRDEGSGIDAAHLPRIRERFFRPPGQAQSGSGLGLSIVERIAQLHGWALDLYNHPQGGLEAKVFPPQAA